MNLLNNKEKAQLPRSLYNIQALLENETTDDLSKWRNFCLSQLTQIQFLKYAKKKKVSKYSSELQTLQQSFEAVCGVEQEILENKRNIQEAIQNAKKQEELIRDKIEHAHQSYEKQTNLTMILSSAPTFLKTRLQVHKIKTVDTLKKMDLAVSLLDKLISRILAINQKVQLLTKLICQNKSKYNQYQEEVLNIQNQINNIVIPEFSQEIESISLKFKNSTEASKTLFAINDKISYYERELEKTKKLDYRPSDCAAIETLIEQEKQKQKNIRDSIYSQYNQDQLKQEIFEAKQRVSELTVQLSEIETESSIKVSELRSQFDTKEQTYQNQIQQNERKIKSLNQKIEDLKKIVPKIINSEKKSCQTNTAFPLPSYF